MGFAGLGSLRKSTTRRSAERRYTLRFLRALLFKLAFVPAWQKMVKSDGKEL